MVTIVVFRNEYIASKTLKRYPYLYFKTVITKRWSCYMKYTVPMLIILYEILSELGAAYF